MNTVQGRYSMSGSTFRNVSEEVKQMLRGMLCVDPDDRLSTEDVLKHPWIVKNTSPAAVPIAVSHTDSGTAGNALYNFLVWS